MLSRTGAEGGTRRAPPTRPPVAPSGRCRNVIEVGLRARSGPSTRRASMPMEVRVCEEIAAPAAKVWALMRGFGDLMQWMQGLESCELAGSGVGAVRTVTLPGGLRLQERLEAFDDAGRSFSYAIVGNSPLPMRDYLSSVKIREKRAERLRGRLGRSLRAEGRQRGCDAEGGPRHLHERDRGAAQEARRLSASGRQPARSEPQASEVIEPAAGERSRRTSAAARTRSRHRPAATSRGRPRRSPGTGASPCAGGRSSASRSR